MAAESDSEANKWIYNINQAITKYSKENRARRYTVQVEPGEVKKGGNGEN